MPIISILAKETLKMAVLVVMFNISPNQDLKAALLIYDPRIISLHTYEKKINKPIL